LRWLALAAVAAVPFDKLALCCSPRTTPAGRQRLLATGSSRRSVARSRPRRKSKPNALVLGAAVNSRPSWQEIS
jgi:hypothetical protein